MLFLLKPEWSYKLNAEFEDHAEHEYMEFVRDHPDLEGAAWESVLAEDYGRFASQADLFRQIGYDERVHKEESLGWLAAPRFS